MRSNIRYTLKYYQYQSYHALCSEENLLGEGETFLWLINKGKIACSIQKYSHWLVGLPDPHPFCLRIYNARERGSQARDIRCSLSCCCCFENAT